MNTSLFSPAPDEGVGTPKGKGGSPAAIQRGNDLKAGVAAPADGPRFDQGLHYGTVRYPGDPATPPLSDGGRVKMGLSRRNNENMQTFVANHITSMTGNPNFVTPMPAAADFLETFSTFQTAYASWVAARSACDEASETLEAARVALDESMNVRGAYVQTESNGNRQVIVSSGLELRNTPTPVGPLPPPINIRIDLNGVPGVMKMRWQGVEGSRGFLVQCSEDVTPRVWTQIKNTSKTSLILENMDVGKIYVFRLASQGGSTGQSPWSAEVIRGAA